MNTKDLICFETVYMEKSINQAAKKLYITPQGLSKIVKNIENELDTQLFKRTPQGVIPTQSAHFLYGKAEILKNQFEEIEYGVRQLENKRKILRIGCAMGVLNVLPIYGIFSFMEKYPELEVQWCEYSNQEVKNKVKSSEIDIGFIVGDYGDDELVKIKVTSRKVLLLVYKGHPLYNQTKVKLLMLKGEKLIIMNEHFHVYHEFQRKCLENDYVPHIISKTGDSMFLHIMCKQKMGLAVVTDFVIEDLKLEDMKALSFEEDIRWDVYCIHKENSQCLSNINKFKKHIKALL